VGGVNVGAMKYFKMIYMEEKNRNYYIKNWGMFTEKKLYYIPFSLHNSA